MRYTPLLNEVELLIDHLSDVKREPSPDLVRKAADHLSMMMLEGTPVLQVLKAPEDPQLRIRAIRYLRELEKVIARKCPEESSKRAPAGGNDHLDH